MVGKIDLPTKKTIPEQTIVQEQTINPDEFIGKKMESRDFISKLSLPDGYKSIDDALTTQEKVYGWIHSIDNGKAKVTLGLASDSPGREHLRGDHPIFLTVMIPLDQIPQDHRELGIVIPLSIKTKRENERYTQHVPRSFKYYVTAAYYDQKKHGEKLGSIGLALRNRATISKE